MQGTSMQPPQLSLAPMDDLTAMLLDIPDDHPQEPPSSGQTSGGPDAEDELMRLLHDEPLREGQQHQTHPQPHPSAELRIGTFYFFL